MFKNVEKAWLEFRDYFIEYPVYVLWVISRNLHVFVLFFGILSMFFWTQSVNWYNHLKIVNKNTYIEVYTDTITTVHPLVLTNHLLDNTLKELLYQPVVRVLPDGSLNEVLLKVFTVKNTYKDYTVEIKEQAKWQDGSSITAKDIAFTYEFMKKNFPTTPLGKTLAKTKIKIVNNRTIEFQLKDPYVGFMRQLTVPTASYQLYKDKSLNDLLHSPYSLNLQTAGAYRIKDIKIDSLTLVPYKDADFNVVWQYQRTPEVAYYELITGKADAYVITYSESDVYQRLKNNPYITVTDYPIIYEIKGLFFNFNKKDSALKDLALRQELLSLLKPQIFTNEFNSLPAYSVYPKQAKYFNNELEYMRNKPLSADKIKPFTFKLSYLDVISEQKVATYIKDYLAKYNIVVELDPIDVEDFEYKIIENKDFDVLLYGINIGADPDQSAFWHSKGNLNITGLKDTTIDNLLEQGLATYNTIQREVLYKELQKEIVLKKVSFIPLFHPNLHVAYRTTVKNMKINTKSFVLTSPVDRVLYAYPYEDYYQADQGQK